MKTPCHVALQILMIVVITTIIIIIAGSLAYGSELDDVYDTEYIQDKTLTNKEKPNTGPYRAPEYTSPPLDTQSGQDDAQIGWVLPRNWPMDTKKLIIRNIGKNYQCNCEENNGQ